MRSSSFSLSFISLTPFKAALISLAAGFVIACIVNLVLGREKLTFEYRMQQRIQRAKKYGLVPNDNEQK